MGNTSKNQRLTNEQNDKTKFHRENLASTGRIIDVDVRGLQCPGPLMATYNAINCAQIGDRIRVLFTDCGFGADAENWCQTNGHKLVSNESKGDKYEVIIEKGEKKFCDISGSTAQTNATMVVFSGELDKAIASMIIAQGAAAAGKDVTMFFTFWGLNVLRKYDNIKVKKNIIERAFGVMMPKGAKKLPLSKMNMLGMGPTMIKGIMKEKNVDDLDTMIRKTKEVGVKMIACTMSMELMGIHQEELIDGIEYAGVASYIAANENAGTTLFI